MDQQNNRKLRIAVLFGGQSHEHEVSLYSSINVIRNIDLQKYDITIIGIDKYGRWNLYNDQFYLLNVEDPDAICLAPTPYYLALIPGISGTKLINVTNGQPLPAIDIAFSLLHGANGENGSVQGLLRVLNIPYVGSDVLCSAICMDKDITKCILRNAGIKVTPSITLLRSSTAKINFETIIDNLGLPLFIKPANQGSSIGVSKVTDRAKFDSALTLAFRYDNKVIIEKGINGREIEIAVLGNDFPEVSVCGEIIVKNKFYDYKSKYFNKTQAELIIPADLPEFIADALRKIAIDAYIVLGCSVMARIDFFLTDKDQIIINEVNTLPGFTTISMYPKLWEASGLSYSALINRLISLSVARYKFK